MTIIDSDIRRGFYADSVVLMQLQSDLVRLPGVLEAGVVMATGANLDLLRTSGLLQPAMERARAEDLIIVVRAETEKAAAAALAQVDRLLERKRAASSDDFRPKSLRAAVRQLPEARWTLVSTPGRYAGTLAEEALDLGRSVFLYSDNVPLRQEVALKQRAAGAGLLVMGPDCGSAMIAGAGFGFTNRVRQGAIGLVCASGTGLQAIASRIHELGAGVSHAIGTGGRDLQAEVGGITARQALDLLARDPQTEVVVLASKPPDRRVGAELLAQAVQIEKPVVVYFSGHAAPAPAVVNLRFARGSAEAAELAVGLCAESALAGADRAAASTTPTPGLIRGLFAGGTLALETAQGLLPFLVPLHANVSAPHAVALSDLSSCRGHAILDLGADEFTVGRLHPMMDQQLRLQHLRQQATDTAVNTIVLDVVLGTGAHTDPAAELAPAISECTRRTDLEVVVIVVGTDEDPQDLDSTVTRLGDAGATVYRTVSDALGHLVLRHTHPPSTAPAVALEAIERPVAAINVGLESFYRNLVEQEVPSVHVAWRPPAGGNERLMSILEKMKTW